MNLTKSYDFILSVAIDIISQNRNCQWQDESCLTARHSWILLFVTVNKIKQNREVTINIPDEMHGSAIIRIEGQKQGVDEAKAVCSYSINALIFVMIIKYLLLLSAFSEVKLTI